MFQSIYFVCLMIGCVWAGMATDRFGNLDLSSNQSIRIQAPNITIPESSALRVELEPSDPLHVANKRYVDVALQQLLDGIVSFWTQSKIVLVSNASGAVSFSCGQDFQVRKCIYVHTLDSVLNETHLLDDAAKILQTGAFQSHPNIEIDACHASDLGQTQASASFPGSIMAAVAAQCSRNILIE